MLKPSTIQRAASIDDLLDPALASRLSGVDLASRKVFAGRLQGERRSKKRGTSVEFADHRPYANGDDIRRIDWNLYGRLDRLFLKLFMEEEDLSFHLVIDASASSDTGEPNKFLFMQRAAMALGYIGLVNLNRVAATFIGGSAETPSAVRSIRDLRGRRRVHDLARFMCDISPAGTLDFRKAAERVALSRRGRGVMVILSDFLFRDGYEDGLRLLSGRGYDLFCIQTLSPQEVKPTVTGDLRLKDLEDGMTSEVTVSAGLLKKYDAAVASYCAGLRDFGTRRDITVVTVASNLDLGVLIFDYLRRRGLVA